jgi:HEAT repeat protein
VAHLFEPVGAYDTLAALATDPDKDVREAAVEALMRRGELAVPALIRRLDHTAAEDRAMTAAVLSRMGPTGRAAAPALARVMRDDPDWSVRVTAAQALDRVAGDDPATVAVLARALADGAETDRCQAAALLAGHPERPDVVVPALAAATRDSNWRVRLAAVEALERLGPTAAAAAPALADAARDPVPCIRPLAAEALERLTARP